ncbi:replication initiation protein [Planococcus sp. S3-L1]|uniref:replication initiation protein n=1 Tax=Planococcus sp. S3-L1 TaxID=3046200 RepID=UPI0024B8D8CE|nr:replication initiation protein [Planococcus sp. S3-L1]MDJ0332649.1 replication initiation protein [Planococcus sp. S3-L1]
MEHQMTSEGKHMMEIYQGNALTEMEKKIIFIVAGLVNKTDQEDQTYELPIDELYRFLELEGLNSDLQFKEIIDELLSKVVEIPREDGGWLMTHWLASVKYVKETEVIQFTFSSNLIPYFLQLKKYLFNCKS